MAKSEDKQYLKHKYGVIIEQSMKSGKSELLKMAFVSYLGLIIKKILNDCLHKLCCRNCQK